MPEQGNRPLYISSGKILMICCSVLAGLLGAYLLSLPLAVGFALGLIVLIVTLINHGILFKDLWRYMAEGAGHTKEVMLILLLVGMLIPAWMASGTIPYLIDAGLMLVHPSYFVTGSFVLAAIVSMLLGTSTGTISSVGIPLIGMAAFLHIPLPLAAGAVISGAFIGDRTSPISSAHRLVAASTGLTVRELVGALLPTTFAGIAVCFLIYGISDWQGQWAQGLEGSVPITGFYLYFRYHAVLLIPPVVLLGAILLRWKTHIAFLLSAVASVVLGARLQGIGAEQWIRYMWSGFASDALPNLHAKGVSGMVSLIVLIGLAGAFNGILEETGLTRPYAERIIGSSSSLLRATWGAVLFGLGLALVCCTQSLPIMMTGRSLLEAWTKRFQRGALARATADGSLVFAPLVPWNMVAVLCSTIVGVPVAEYAGYAVFLWVLPLLTLLMTLRVTGKRKPSSVIAAESLQ